MTELTPPPNEPENAKQNTAGFVDIINALADRIDPLLQLLTAFAQRSLREKTADARYRVRMAWIAVAVVTLIVGIAALLTYVGKIDGSTFTFLLGLIVGYVLTFLRDAIDPPASD